MTKKEIVKQISDKLSISQSTAKDVVQLTLDLIVDALIEEGRIELRKFGVFEVRRRKPRMARNPRTGAVVTVPSKNVVSFQPGKIMEDQVTNCKNPIEPKIKSRHKVTATTIAESSADAPISMGSEVPLKPR